MSRSDSQQRDSDPMTTATAEMFMRQRDEALAEVERLREALAQFVEPVEGFDSGPERVDDYEQISLLVTARTIRRGLAALQQTEKREENQ